MCGQLAVTPTECMREWSALTQMQTYHTCAHARENARIGTPASNSFLPNSSPPCTLHQVMSEHESKSKERIKTSKWVPVSWVLPMSDYDLHVYSTYRHSTLPSSEYDLQRHDEQLLNTYSRSSDVGAEGGSWTRYQVCALSFPVLTSSPPLTFSWPRNI